MSKQCIIEGGGTKSGFFHSLLRRSFVFICLWVVCQLTGCGSVAGGPFGRDVKEALDRNHQQGRRQQAGAGPHFVPNPLSHLSGQRATVVCFGKPQPAEGAHFPRHTIRKHAKTKTTPREKQTKSGRGETGEPTHTAGTRVRRRDIHVPPNTRARITKH